MCSTPQPLQPLLLPSMLKSLKIKLFDFRKINHLTTHKKFKVRQISTEMFSRNWRLTWFCQKKFSGFCTKFGQENDTFESELYIILSSDLTV